MITVFLTHKPQEQINVDISLTESDVMVLSYGQYKKHEK